LIQQGHDLHHFFFILPKSDSKAVRQLKKLLNLPKDRFSIKQWNNDRDLNLIARTIFCLCGDLYDYKDHYRFRESLLENFVSDNDRKFPKLFMLLL